MLSELAFVYFCFLFSILRMLCWARLRSEIQGAKYRNIDLCKAQSVQGEGNPSISSNNPRLRKYMQLFGIRI